VALLASLLPVDGASPAAREKIHARADELGLLETGAVAVPSPSAYEAYFRSVQRIANREMWKFYIVRGVFNMAPWVILYGSIFVLAYNDDGGVWQAAFLAVALVAFVVALAWAIWLGVRFSSLRRKNRPAAALRVQQQCLRFAEVLVGAGPVGVDRAHSAE